MFFMQFLLFLLALQAASASEEQNLEQVGAQIALLGSNVFSEDTEPPIDTLRALTTGRDPHGSNGVPLLRTNEIVDFYELVSGFSNNFESSIDIGMDVFGNKAFVQMVLDSMGFKDIDKAFLKHSYSNEYDRFVLTTIAEFGFDVARKCNFGSYLDEVGISNWFGQSDTVVNMDTMHENLLKLAKKKCPEFIAYLKTHISAQSSYEILKHVTENGSATLDVPEMAERLSPEQLIALMPPRGQWSDKQYVIISKVAKAQETNRYIVAAADARRGDIMAFLLLSYRQDYAAKVFERDWTVAGINLPLEYSRMPLEFLAPYDNLHVVKLLYDAKYYTQAKSYFDKYAVQQPKTDPKSIILSAGKCGSVDMVCSVPVVEYFGLHRIATNLEALVKNSPDDSALKEGCIVALAKLYVQAELCPKTPANNTITWLAKSLKDKFETNALWIKTVNELDPYKRR